MRKRVAKPAPAAADNRGIPQNDLAKRLDRIEQMLQAAQRARLEPLGMSRKDVVVDEAAAVTADFLRHNSPVMPSPATSSHTVKLEEGGPQDQPMAGTFDTAPPARSASSSFSAAPLSCAPFGIAFSPSSSMPSGVGFLRLHFAGLDLGEVCSFNGAPYFSATGMDWIREKSGAEPSFESIYARMGLQSGLGTTSMPRSNPGRASAGPGIGVDDGKLWRTGPQIMLSDKGNLRIGDMHNILHRLSAVDLPDRSLLEQRVKEIRKSLNGLNMPVVDPILFAATIETAYSYYGSEEGDRRARSSGAASGEGNASPALDSPLADEEGGSSWQRRGRERTEDDHLLKESMDALCAKGCIFAFMAMVGVVLTDDGGLPPVDGDEYAAAAHLLVTEFLPAASVVTLETAIMLCIYHVFSGQLQSACMFLTGAIRVLFILGGNTAQGAGFLDENETFRPIIENHDKIIGDDGETPRETPDARLRRHLRNLYRMCYIFDKEITLRTGLPPGMDNDYCDLGILEHSWSLDSTGLPLDTALPRGNSCLNKYSLTLREAIAFKTKLEPWQMRLAIIESRVSKLLYSVASLRKSDAEILRDIRELDDEVDRWRSSLPPEYRPMLMVPVKRKSRTRRGAGPAGSRAERGTAKGELPTISSPHTFLAQLQQQNQHHHHRQQPKEPFSEISAEQDAKSDKSPAECLPSTGSPSLRAESAQAEEEDETSDDDDDDDDGITVNEQSRRHLDDVVVHFKYNYILATIHRASGRCRAWTADDREMAGVSSSQALAVQASRSTLLYLRTAGMSLSGMVFWVFFFYPMSAILTIFCNVLLRPLDASAEDDLELLASTDVMIKEMRRRRKLTPKEMEHLTMIEEFVAEMTRLGHCAIVNAGREGTAGPKAASTVPGNPRAGLGLAT